MKIKKNNDKSSEFVKDISFWKFSLKKSMEKRLNKKDESKKNSAIIISNNNGEDQLTGSDNESFTDSTNSDKYKEDNSDSSQSPEQLRRQLDILAFESEDESILDDEEAFTSFSKLNLPCNAAHLSVFINFTIVHSISEHILFYLITNLYKNGCAKDMKKWSYEIYSSFLAPFSPLKVLNVDDHQSMLNDIEKKLIQVAPYDPVDNIISSYDFEMLRLLRDMFYKPRCVAKKIIDKQLTEFQNKRKAGLETLYGASTADLKAAKQNDKMQQVVIEKNLMPKLLQMLEDLEDNNENNSKICLVAALSTVIHNTFHPRITYFEPIDQFVSNTNHSTKMEISMKGHHMTPLICYTPTNCDYCLNVLWGLAPQGYACDCGIKIHESCIEKINGVCILHSEDNDSDREINESKDSSRLMEFVHKAIGNRHIENYKRNKGDRPKSDPGLYSLSSNNQSTDSSDDGSLDESIWSTDVTSDSYKLSEDEKRRREIIMELFETERRHVKTLKVLQNIFLEPLKRTKSVSFELANMLFPPAFFIIKDWHISFETMLKKEWQEQHGILLRIGNCLSMFEDQYGNILKENVATFCAGQKTALEALRITRSKNDALQRGLIKAESHKKCKRLQLKDLMLSILQRITKYPLLFERILKYSNGTEHQQITKAYESSKLILSYVNNVIKNSEELHAIQTRLDKSLFMKDVPIEYRNFNLTDHKLIYDGKGIMKKCPIVLRMLLFQKILVFLHKQDDKYYLKPCESMKLPIVKLYKTIVRSNAIDNKSFYLISQTENDSQMLEINTFTEAECQLWIQNISDAIDKVNDSMTLKRKPSAESAQSMLRHESQINLPLLKKSELATLTQALYTQSKHIEEWIHSAQRNLCSDSHIVESKDSDTISISLSTFNCLISQLSIKIAERDHERDIYMRENQRLREHKKL